MSNVTSETSAMSNLTSETSAMAIGALFKPTYQTAFSRPKFINNIDYITSGYNLFRGSPFITPIDEGLTRRNIFELEYNKNNNYNGYTVPDNINVYGLNSCSIDFQSTVMIGETSLTKNFKNDVRFSVKGFGAAFKASTSF
jgi:hypothetical protein